MRSSVTTSLAVAVPTLPGLPSLDPTGKDSRSTDRYAKLRVGQPMGSPSCVTFSLGVASAEFGKFEQLGSWKSPRNAA
jgi:hypothetical protein